MEINYTQYKIRNGDSLHSISSRLEMTVEDLKLFHNSHCEKTETLWYENMNHIKSLWIPKNYKTEEQKAQEKTESLPSLGLSNPFYAKEYKGSEEENQQESPSSAKPQKEEKKEDDKKKDNNSDDHESTYFVIQKATLQCNQGFTFPTLKVTSHQKHYANHSDNDPDYLAATEDDLQLNPTSQPFGQCKLKPSSSGYLPCAYAPAGKWQKAYDKTKVMDKACLTERSELMCSTGGKITILNHGQQSEITKSHINNANTLEQQAYNPVVDFDALKEEADDNEAEAW